MPETRNSKSSAGSPGTGIDKNSCSEFVTTSMLNEMLQLQERMFKSLVDSLLNNFNSRLDTVVESVADLKTRLNICQKASDEFKASLEFSQKDIDELKLKIETEVEADINDIYDCIDYHMDKLEFLENQSQRNNIRIDGISEEENESWDSTAEKVKQVLTREARPCCSARHRTRPSCRSGCCWVPEDALARLSVGFATGDIRSRSLEVREESSPLVYLSTRILRRKPWRSARNRGQKWKRLNEMGKWLTSFWTD